MQTWLDAYSRWLYKKLMTWESIKCTAICQSEEEVQDDSFKLYISGKEINKAVSATYIGIKMTSRGLEAKRNIEREEETRRRTSSKETAERVSAPWNRTRFVLETYLKSATYTMRC